MRARCQTTSSIYTRRGQQQVWVQDNKISPALGYIYYHPLTIFRWSEGNCWPTSEEKAMLQNASISYATHLKGMRYINHDIWPEANLRGNHTTPVEDTVDVGNCGFSVPTCVIPDLLYRLCAFCSTRFSTFTSPDIFIWVYVLSLDWA